MYSFIAIFSNSFDALISFSVGVLIIIGRIKFNKYFERDLDKKKINYFKECRSCNGTGTDPSADIYNNYGMSTVCRECSGDYEKKFRNLDGCESCHGEGYVWSKKRKQMCKCVLIRDDANEF